MNSAAIARRVDRLGALKAEIANLEAEVKKVREELEAAGVKEGEGKLFSLQFSQAVTSRVDWNRVKEDYDLPLEKYTSTSVSVRMLVKAR